MAQNKEQLNKLLQFISRLIDEPGNEDFVNGLRKLLDVPIHNSGDDKKIADIEKYLGLDYQLDSATPFVDYSFVNVVFVKEQLISDYREMMRYRYGVRSHKIDFSEYCRYAMLQVELLLNFFYSNNFENNNQIKDYINSRATWAKLEKVESVKSLSLAVKMSAFYGEKGDRKIRDTLEFSREVRNEQSHRDSNDGVDFTREFRKKLIDMGLPLTKEGEVYWNGIKDNELLLSKYKTLQVSELWTYRYKLWRLREPFDDIHNTLKETAGRVRELISCN